jgi:uncharacterized repeat protein (TIGR03803 family)
MIASGGSLYGTTYYGGNSNQGVIFVLKPPASSGGAWTQKVLHRFAGPDGANPHAGLIAGPGGVFYGTTLNGGSEGQGTIFSLAPPVSPGGAWNLNVLYNFSGSDGSNPHAGVVLGKTPKGQTVLYGITLHGGTAGYGVVFSLTTSTPPAGPWAEATLYNFAGGSDAASPYAAPVIGSDSTGNIVLYGTTDIRPRNGLFAGAAAVWERAMD